MGEGDDEWSSSSSSDSWGTSGNASSSSSSSSSSDGQPRRTSLWPFVAIFMAAAAVGHVFSLRRRFFNFEQVLQRGTGAKQSSSRKASSSDFHNTNGSRAGKNSGFSWKFETRNENPWARVQQSLQEEHMEMLRRMEHMMRLQDNFLREKSRYTGRYDQQQDQDFNVEYWYWNGESWAKWGNENPGNKQGRSKPFDEGYDFARSGGNSSMKRHFKVLGLDWEKADSYSDADIKAAYRAKAMEFHPDRNQHRKEYTESKFREVVAAYEALKKARK